MNIQILTFVTSYHLHNLIGARLNVGGPSELKKGGQILTFTN